MDSLRQGRYLRAFDCLSKLRLAVYVQDQEIQGVVFGAWKAPAGTKNSSTGGVFHEVGCPAIGGTPYSHSFLWILCARAVTFEHSIVYRSFDWRCTSRTRRSRGLSSALGRPLPAPRTRPRVVFSMKWAVQLLGVPHTLIASYGFFAPGPLPSSIRLSIEASTGGVRPGPGDPGGCLRRLEGACRHQELVHGWCFP